MFAYINTSFEEMSSQLGSDICAYLLEALHCESLELFLKNSPQVVICKVLCLVKIYYCLYKLDQFVLCSLVCVDSVSVFTSLRSLFFLCRYYDCRTEGRYFVPDMYQQRPYCTVVNQLEPLWFSANSVLPILGIPCRRLSREYCERSGLQVLVGSNSQVKSDFRAGFLQDRY